MANIKSALFDWVHALRVHQWSKNVLVLVPLFTSFTFIEPERVKNGVIAFLVFSGLASATYLINDLRDIEHDRKHPRKKFRPLADGRISKRTAVVVAILLTLISMSIAVQVSKIFALALAIYLLMTLSYSAVLKSIVLVDVIVLAGLYTLRIVAGGLAIKVELSPWLLTFAMFLFLSLALVKRCSELISLPGSESTSGRDYSRNDLAILTPLGIGAGLCAVIVLALFISTLETQNRYAHPRLLWLVCVAVLYWIGRLWIKTGRGEMHDDPIVFTARDRGSIAAVITLGVLTLAAYFGIGTELAAQFGMDSD